LENWDVAPHQFIDSLSKRRLENPGSDVLEHDGEGKTRVRIASSGVPDAYPTEGKPSVDLAYAAPPKYMHPVRARSNASVISCYPTSWARRI